MDTAMYKARADELKDAFKQASTMFGNNNRTNAMMVIINDSLKLKHEIRGESEYKELDTRMKSYDAIVDSLPIKDCADALGESEYHTDNGGLKMRLEARYDVPAIYKADPQGFIRNIDRLFDEKGKFSPTAVFKDESETHLTTIIKAHSKQVKTAWIETKA